MIHELFLWADVNAHILLVVWGALVMGGGAFLLIRDVVRSYLGRV